MELNGRPVALEELLALGLVGYGHFTSMRIERGRGVRGLALHLARLARDCREVFAAELDTDLVGTSSATRSARSTSRWSPG
ncbi:hypothetical protein ACFWM1_18780 [Nocardia sp. NPDC058379]|uniref:hypothetical protein n=1 Tax=unclassified Nocardia TaxID=2637762 RepID=UPI003647C876